ncbi:hypothetical protein P3T33_004751 [Rhizobium sp. AN67]|nr:hypothetical protein [Rhizobium sp. AN67]
MHAIALHVWGRSGATLPRKRRVAIKVPDAKTLVGLCARLEIANATVYEIGASFKTHNPFRHGIRIASPDA